MKGEVVYLYAFDVANEIVTDQVAKLLGQKPVPFEIGLPRDFPKDVPLYKPLAVEFSLEHPLQDRSVRVLVRIYDVGVVTVTMRVQIEVASLQDLAPCHHPQTANGQPLDRLALDLCLKVCTELEDFLVQGSPPSEGEAYTVFCLTDLGEVQDVNAWLTDQRRAVAGLLTDAPPEMLSEAQVAEVLRLQRSFAHQDLVAIDWDAALVVDLTGYVDDVLYVLEVANLQLGELRMMDQRLDRYLARAYADLGRRQFVWLRGSARVLRLLRRFRVDVTKLADEVSNITKFVGDWYLARVYLAAHERFHLDQWRRSVEGRLALLDQLYQVVHSEVNEWRMLWLEAVIVVLFLIDVLALFLGKR
jgi:hypothetical protein